MAQRKPPWLTNAIHVQGLVCMTTTGVLKCSLATGFQLLSCWFRIKSLAQEGCPFSALYEHITPDTSQHVKSQGPSSQFQIKRIPQSLAQFPSCRLDGQACGLSREGKLVLCQVGIKEIILRDIVPQRHHVVNSEHNKSKGCCTIDNSMRLLPDSKTNTWGRGWMTKASGVGERRKGRGELRRDCHHRVAALFVPTRMQQWYMIYNNDIYIYGGGGRGGPFAWKSTWCPWGAPEYLLKQEDSSELTLAFVIMPIIANNDKM